MNKDPGFAPNLIESINEKITKLLDELDELASSIQQTFLKREAYLLFADGEILNKYLGRDFDDFKKLDII